MFLDLDRQVLFKVSDKYVSVWLTLGRKKHFCRKLRAENNVWCFGSKPFRSYQRGFSSEFKPFLDIFSIIRSFCSSLSTVFIHLKAILNPRNHSIVASLLIDITTLLVELKDPFNWTPFNLVKFVARVFSLVLRLTSYSRFVSESLFDVSSFDALCVALAIFDIPEFILKKVKLLSIFTTKKIFDNSNIFITCFETIISFITDLFEYYFPNDLYVLPLLQYPKNFLCGYRYLKTLEKLYMKYVQNPQVMFDRLFRDEVNALGAEMKTSRYFLDSVLSPHSKSLNSMYNTFTSVILKQASTFDTSSRVEPICIVLEGPAGCGKSTLMNSLVSFLSSQNLSVYTHSCVPANIGKDFYDDYLNQDVFVMDDVGQQSVSQWRQIINFVSPVKHPLECAAAELKNTKFFSSKVIIVTTNHFSDLHGFTKDDAIAEPQALFRRCHVINFNEVKKGPQGPTGSVFYSKFSHVTERWHKKEFPPELGSLSLPCSSPIEKRNETVAWVVSLIALLRKKSKANSDTMNADQSQEIKDLINAQNPFLLHDLENAFSSESDFLTLSMLGDFSQAWLDYFYSTCKMFLDRLTETVSELLSFSKQSNDTESKSWFSKKEPDVLDKNLSVFCVASLGILLVSICYFSFFKSHVPEEGELEFKQSVIKEWREAMKSSTNTLNSSPLFYSQTLSTRVVAIQDRMRLVELQDDDGNFNMFQGLVSGRFILTQYHAYKSQKGVVNVFKTWNDSLNRKYELNGCPFSVCYENADIDLAIIRLEGSLPQYKNSVNLLIGDLSRKFSKNLSFVNCEAIVDLTGSFKLSDSSYTISNLKKNIIIQPGQTIQYGISSSGLCGSLIIDNDYGLVGMHIAGNGSLGCAMLYSRKILEEISEILGKESAQYDVHPVKIQSQFSGARYYADEGIIAPPKKSHLVPTCLFEELTPHASKEGLKCPPNLSVFGHKTLETLALKSYKPVPLLPNDEIEFGKKCLRTFMTTFHDISDKEVIRGNEHINSLNMDSVNGVGYEKDKNLYINSEEGVCTDLFRERLDDFVRRCNNDDLCIKDLLFYETLKDELRPVEKANKPRCFRIGPLHHVFFVEEVFRKSHGPHKGKYVGEWCGDRYESLS